MENKEMNNNYESERTYDRQDNGYTHGYPTADQAAEAKADSSSEEIYSHSSSYSSDNTAQPVQENTQTAANPAYNANTYSGSYPQYNSGYTAQNTGYSSTGYQPPVYSEPYNVMNHPAKPRKSSGKGKTVALVAGTLALALCVGIGGGILGSRLASGSDQTADTIQTSSTASKSENKSNSDKSESSSNKGGSLNITKASDDDIKPTTIQEATAKVKDSVVEITTESTEYNSFYGQYISQGAGSGVIISEDGYILTNNHVIEDATTITVRLTNSKTYEAKVIGKDATLDIALIKIEEKGLTTAAFGDSSKLNVGQDAIVIGNPLGRLGGTVTNGIISALDREIKIDGKTMNLLQTNAAINPGNSGGGLFDANGNLVGIVVAKSSTSSSGTSVEGLGYAIPINDVLDILDDLKTAGHVTGRGNLGINIVTVSTDNAKFMYRVDKYGVYVSAVTSGSAAEKAGLKVGDMIVEFNGKTISQGSDLTSAVSRLKAGTEVTIKIERDGKEETINATLDEKQVDDTQQDSRQEQNNNNYYYGGNGGNFEDFFGMG